MTKIIRLSWANIRRRKLETVSLLILVLLCTMLAGSAFSGQIGIRGLFPNLMEKTGFYENTVMFPKKDYEPEFEDLLSKRPEVETISRSEMLGGMSTKFLTKTDKEQALTMMFITPGNLRKIGKGELQTTLSQEAVSAMEHPIYMPSDAKATLGLEIGDPFTVLCGTKKYNFTLAGFCEVMMFDTAGGGYMMIVNDPDYHAMESVLTPYTILAYNDHQGQGGIPMLEDYIRECESCSGRDIYSGFLAAPYEAMKTNVDMTCGLLLKIILVMAAIIVLSVTFMIRFRVAGDIQEQIVSIGVLEALGYTSKDIAFSYVMEYLLITLAGAVPGMALCCLFTPVIFSLCYRSIGHTSVCRISLLPIFLTVLCLLLFVALIAYFRARAVRHYPPVRALRKGQGDHRFGKEHFPLRDTKHSVHIRIALQGFMQNFRKSLGLTFSILISAVAILFSFILFSFFSDTSNAISSAAGIELSDLNIELMESEDSEAFAAMLSAMPEVKKVIPTNSMNLFFNVPDCSEHVIPVSFRDFDSTENIFPAKGRFPEHDNEIMLCNVFAKTHQIAVGDSITLEYLGVQRKYLVTGFVTSLTNGGLNVYITQDGITRLMPTYRPTSVEVYLQPGTDREAFTRNLIQLYGKSIADAADTVETDGSLEVRIRAEAERQIAEMMSMQGASHVEYSIQYDDVVISGNSSAFRIKSIMNVQDIIQTQVGGTATAIGAGTLVFMLVSAFVVMIILLILMESSVRKQRRELGIMKSMGYTSKELMFQLTCRIMPAVLCAIVIGIVVSVSATKYLTSFVGRISVNLPAVILLGAVLAIFCFGCAYVGARKIKKISVYELMTE